MDTKVRQGLIMIHSLPLDDEVRTDFIERANEVFERIVERIEPKNERVLREFWDPGYYIDNEVLMPSMLPISRDYAISLVEAFLLMHVVSLAVAADHEEA